MKNPGINVVANLSSAEQALAGAINDVADRVDRLGTNVIQDAIDRLKASADACKARLASAAVQLAEIAEGLVDDMDSLTDVITAALEDDDLVELPARAPLGGEIIELSGPVVQPSAEPPAPSGDEIDLAEPATLPSEPVLSVAANSPVEPAEPKKEVKPKAKKGGGKKG